jgi:hypothetical protein
MNQKVIALPDMLYSSKNTCPFERKGIHPVCPGRDPAVYPLIREQVMNCMSVKPFFLSDPDIPKCSVSVENPGLQR